MATCSLQNQIQTFVGSTKATSTTTEVDIDTRNVEVVTFACPSIDYYQITIRGYSISETTLQVQNALQGVTSPNTFSYQIVADSVGSETSATAATWVYNTLSSNVDALSLQANALVLQKGGNASGVLTSILNSSSNAFIYLGKNSNPGNSGNIRFDRATTSLKMNTSSLTDQLTLSASAGTVATNSNVTISGFPGVPRQTKIPSIAVTGATAVDLGTFTYTGIRQFTINFRNLVGSSLPYVQIGGAAGWYATTPTHDNAYSGNSNFAETNYLQWIGTGIPLWFTETGPYNISGSLEFTWLGGTSEQWSVRGMVANTTTSSFMYSMIQGVVTCAVAGSPTVTNVRVVAASAFSSGAIYGMTF